MERQELKVLELFAGVGGFRIGFENSNPDVFITKWSNQWEPKTKNQDAFEIYDYHYPDSVNINKDVADISNEEFAAMDADIIVGGFPCQDYSVARGKKGELGIKGKKGVLFWEIIRATEVIKPKYLILENVDRLLKSPSKQRGRDFAIMLSSFNQLGYSVEWRVINAANYGRAQRRRRVFIFVYRNDTDFAKRIDKKYEAKARTNLINPDKYFDYIFTDGLFARQFPIKNYPNKGRRDYRQLPADIVEISDKFTAKIWNTGVMRHGWYYTYDTIAIKEEAIPLKDIVQDEEDVAEKYYLSEKQIEKFSYLRGSKKIKRKASNGHEYIYSEGGMSPYDDLDLPARTMLTSEGTVNRSSHLLYIDGRYRFLTPIEAERLQDFPDNWTKYKKDSTGKVEEVLDNRRMFFMGNALVTGIVKRIADELIKIDSLDFTE